MTQYSEEQLQKISEEIIADSVKKREKDTVWLGKNIRNDWNDELFVQELYDDYFLKTVQQGHRNKFTGKIFDVKDTTFEKFLHACLETLTWRREELANELRRDDIDIRTFNNGKEVADMAEGAIRKYLGKKETARLIGV